MLSKYTTSISLMAIILSTSVPMAFATSATSGTSGTSRGTVASNTAATSDWSTEDRYWRENYNSRPYFNRNTSYNSIQPAYRYGVTAFDQYDGRRFEELDEAQLRSGWERARGSSRLSWEQARDATRDAYNRMAERGTTMGSATGTTGTGTTGSSTSPDVSSNMSGGATLGSTTGTTGTGITDSRGSTLGSSTSATGSGTSAGTGTTTGSAGSSTSRSSGSGGTSFAPSSGGSPSTNRTMP